MQEQPQAARTRRRRMWAVVAAAVLVGSLAGIPAASGQGTVFECGQECTVEQLPPASVLACHRNDGEKLVRVIGSTEDCGSHETRLRLSPGEAGKDGQDGATWLRGNGAPADELGKEGDFYLNRLNGDVYRKTSDGIWSIELNIKGAQGQQGAAGIQSNGFSFARDAYVDHPGSASPATCPKGIGGLCKTSFGYLNLPGPAKYMVSARIELDYVNQEAASLIYCSLDDEFGRRIGGLIQVAQATNGAVENVVLMGPLDTGRTLRIDLWCQSAQTAPRKQRFRAGRVSMNAISVGSITIVR